MNKRIMLLLITAMFYGPISAQPQVDTVNFETFNYEHDDSTFVMQKYFLVFLQRGDTKIEDEEKAQKVQQAHLEYLGGLYEQGYICMNGPFGDDGVIRGATVYRVANLDDAKKLAEGDPAVQAGSLKVEIHPWWLARGTGVR